MGPTYPYIDWFPQSNTMHPHLILSRILLASFYSHSTDGLKAPVDWLGRRRPPATKLMFEDFFKVLPSHMKVPPGHYKGVHTSSKGQPPCWFQLLPWENLNKPMNINCTIIATCLLIIMSRIDQLDWWFKVFSTLSEVLSKTRGILRLVHYYGFVHTFSRLACKFVNTVCT